MKLDQLPKLTTKKSKRLGRGYGSGKGGHTASRGQKGQKSRSKVPIWFEGGQLPFIRRLPFIKGKNRFKSFSKMININVRDLEVIKTGTEVTIDSLVKYSIISKANSKHPIKILGRGKLTKSLKVGLPTSMQAAEKIKKAGGEIISSVVEKPPKK